LLVLEVLRFDLGKRDFPFVRAVCVFDLRSARNANRNMPGSGQQKIWREFVPY